MRVLSVTLLGLSLVLPVAATQSLVEDPGTAETDLQFDIRANENLLFGEGVSTEDAYYDVPITNQPADGVIIKLPYTQKGGTLTFDLHHRIARSDDFGLPAEVMTVVDVLTGGTNRLGTYTLLDLVSEDTEFEEEINRASDAEIDRFVTPLSRKTITIDTRPGPQSVSIVGRDLTITRDGLTTRIDTPGTRIAMVSRISFREAQLGEALDFD
jgi:hypothetical protein